MLTLSELKGFLRIDEEMIDDDIYLSSLITTSKAYIINATHPNADPDSDLFRTASLFLSGHWYENRQTVVVGTVSKQLEHTLDNIFEQIKWTSIDIDESGTSKDIRLFDELAKKENLIHRDATEPTDTSLLWLDTVNKSFKYYSQESLSWETLVGGGSSSSSNIDVVDSSVNGHITVIKDGVESDVLVYDESAVLNELANKSDVGHGHEINEVNGLTDALDTKENSFTKNTAFNKDFGTTAGSVAEGNHTHDYSGVYAPKTHGHTESEITDLDKYKKSEVDNKLLVKIDDPSTKKDGDVLTYNVSTGKWEAKAPSTSGGTSSEKFTYFAKFKGASNENITTSYFYPLWNATGVTVLKETHPGTIGTNGRVYTKEEGIYEVMFTIKTATNITAGEIINVNYYTYNVAAGQMDSGSFSVYVPVAGIQDITISYKPRAIVPTETQLYFNISTTKATFAIQERAILVRRL